jgi:hypothetical protein
MDDCIRTVVALHKGQSSPRGRISKKITVAAITRRTSSPPKTRVKIAASDMARILPRSGCYEARCFRKKAIVRIQACFVASMFAPFMPSCARKNPCPAPA